MTLGHPHQSNRSNGSVSHLFNRENSHYLGFAFELLEIGLLPVELRAKASNCLNLISSSKEAAKQFHVALSSVLCCICMPKNFYS